MREKFLWLGIGKYFLDIRRKYRIIYWNFMGRLDGRVF